VTGCDKSKSWGIASFSDASEDSGFSLKFTTAPVGDVDATYHSSWDNHSPATVRIGPDSCSSKPNQCVFVRGFKIAVRESPLAARLFGTVKLTSTPNAKSPKNPGGYSSFRRNGSRSSLENHSRVSSPSSQESPSISDLDSDSDESSDDDGIFDDDIIQDDESTNDGISIDSFPDRSEVRGPFVS
jgi:hypothetical protein